MLGANAFSRSSSGQLVNQFPYEGAIVRKDLLPQTARWMLRAGEVTAAAEGQACSEDTEETLEGGVPLWHPNWLPATYDLATEVQFFLTDYRVVSSLTRFSTFRSVPETECQ